MNTFPTGFRPGWIAQARQRQEERIARRQPAPVVPRPEFVGPPRPFTMDDMYDPRENVPGRTYWGD